MNWTPTQFKEYAQRRLRDEARTREAMQKTAIAAKSRKIQGSGQRHNEKVVRAFFLQHGLPEPRTEWQFDPNRKWRWDYCWNALEDTGMLALEVNGGLWTGGAHVRPARMLEEYEKWNRAACLGWRVLFVTPDQLLKAETVRLVREALAI